MSYLLGQALDQALWIETEAIARPLIFYWYAQCLYAEGDAWTDRARLALEGATGTLPSVSSPAGSLWMVLVGMQAFTLRERGNLDAAEQTYRDILVMLEAEPDSPLNRVTLQRRVPSLAASQSTGGGGGGRGMVCAVPGHQRGTRRPAPSGSQLPWSWCHRAVPEAAGGGGRLACPGPGHQRGTRRPAPSGGQLPCARQRRAPPGRLEEAAGWYARSLAISEELGDQQAAAITYDQLGTVAQRRGRPEEAAGWHARALAISEELGIRHEAAASYHNLGAVTMHQGRLEEAAGWYARSLAIFEELGDRLGAAASCHQLGDISEHPDSWRRAQTGMPGPWPSARNSATGVRQGLNCYKLSIVADQAGGRRRPRAGMPGPWPSR